jgi:sterol desaturase/sphingolipid hydroxylase (fatty acid hydroxylase superfamily)
MIESLINLFAELHAIVFEGIVLPGLTAAGLLAHMEEAFDFTEWFLIGAIEVALLAAILLPLERRFPAERRGPGGLGDRVGTDFAYTLLHRLGAFAVFAFVLLEPIALAARDGWRGWGLPAVEIDALLGLTYLPVIAAFVYLVILDFVDYWIHRFQHGWNWWWSLHAIHHSQRRMTLWTDNRNHLVDDLLRDAILAFVALFIGVMPSQFLSFVVITRVWQSLQHANIGLAFPGWLARLVVSPGFHRLHHAVGLGHEGPARGVNFAVLFPIWDWLFRTADWSAEGRFSANERLPETGIRDQAQGVNYGHGFWQQQWIGLRNLCQSFMRASKSEN